MLGVVFRLLAQLQGYLSPQLPDSLQRAPEEALCCINKLKASVEEDPLRLLLLLEIAPSSYIDTAQIHRHLPRLTDPAWILTQGKTM